MRQHRALRFVIGFLLIAACAGYAWWWHATAERIRAQSNAWIEARRADGWTITTAPLAVGGFPFGWRLDAGAASLARPDGIRVETRSLTARVAPWSPRHVQVEGDAPALSLPEGAARPRGTLTAARGTADVTDTIALSLDSPSWREADASPVTARSAKLGWDRSNATLALDALRLPTAAALGDTVQSVQLACSVEPGLPQGADAASIQRWRDDGGVVQLRNVALDWGPLSLHGEGTAALDAQGRVELAGTARIAGWSETIDALVASGSVKPNGGALAKAGLGLLAKPKDPKDATPPEKNEVSIAVAIQGGQLYLGGIRLGPAPSLKIF